MTFSRLVKLAALLLVAAALWRASPSGVTPRILVLVLPGASQDDGAVAAGSIAAGEVKDSSPPAGFQFWFSLFSADVPAQTGVVQPLPLWAGDGATVRALLLPSRLASGAAPAKEDEEAFVGGSAGAVIEASEVSTNRLPAPYDRAVVAIAAAAAKLRPDEWSEWISVPLAAGAQPASSGSAGFAEFQFVRSSESSWFFSPAYVVRPSPTIVEPFLRGLERELRPLAASHVIALSARRLAAAGQALEDGKGGGATIVFDTVAEDAAGVFAPDTTPGATRTAVRDAIAGEIAALRAAAGKDGILVVVGGPSTGRSAGAGAWYRILAGGDEPIPATGVGEAGSLDAAGLKALVRYVAGIRLDDRERKSLADLMRLLPSIRATTVKRPPPAAKAEVKWPWSAASLESMGESVRSR